MHRENLCPTPPPTRTRTHAFTRRGGVLSILWPQLPRLAVPGPQYPVQRVLQLRLHAAGLDRLSASAQHWLGRAILGPAPGTLPAPDRFLSDWVSGSREERGAHQFSCSSPAAWGRGGEGRGAGELDVWSWAASWLSQGQTRRTLLTGGGLESCGSNRVGEGGSSEHWVTTLSNPLTSVRGQRREMEEG